MLHAVMATWALGPSSPSIRIIEQVLRQTLVADPMNAMAYDLQ
jgi:hypothetical protein